MLKLKEYHHEDLKKLLLFAQARTASTMELVESVDYSDSRSNDLKTSSAELGYWLQKTTEYHVHGLFGTISIGNFFAHQDQV